VNKAPDTDQQTESGNNDKSLAESREDIIIGGDRLPPDIQDNPHIPTMRKPIFSIKRGLFLKRK